LQGGHVINLVSILSNTYLPPVMSFTIFEKSATEDKTAQLLPISTTVFHSATLL
jgi:hypothetical protein